MWVLDDPSKNSAANIPAQLPPRLSRKVNDLLEKSSAADAGSDGPVDFWKWVNGRMAEFRIRPRVPALPASSGSAAVAPPSFDLEGALAHVHRQLPEVL